MALDSITRPRKIRPTREAQAAATMTAPARAEAGHGKTDMIDAMTPGAAESAERLAGLALTGFGLIYLVLLGDISLSAFLAGTDLSTALALRILVLGAVFAGAVLFGWC